VLNSLGSQGSVASGRSSRTS